MNNAFGSDDLFGSNNMNDNNNADTDVGGGWATMDMFGGASQAPKLNLDFAYPPLKETLNQHTKG